MSEEGAAQQPGGEVVGHESPDGVVRVEVLVGEDTVWLTQRQMAHLFDTGSRNADIHIQNAYGEGELVEGATAKDSFVVRSMGGRQVHRRVQDHNLDVVISVGHTWKSMTLGSSLAGSRVALAGVLRRAYTCDQGWGSVEASSPPFARRAGSRVSPVPPTGRSQRRRSEESPRA